MSTLTKHGTLPPCPPLDHLCIAEDLFYLPPGWMQFALLNYLSISGQNAMQHLQNLPGTVKLQQPEVAHFTVTSHHSGIISCPDLIFWTKIRNKFY